MNAGNQSSTHLKSAARKGVRVRPPLPAPLTLTAWLVLFQSTRRSSEAARVMTTIRHRQLRIDARSKEASVTRRARVGKRTGDRA
jgi:hypothetical protein